MFSDDSCQNVGICVCENGRIAAVLFGTYSVSLYGVTPPLAIVRSGSGYRQEYHRNNRKASTRILRNRRIHPRYQSWGKSPLRPSSVQDLARSPRRVLHPPEVLRSRRKTCTRRRAKHLRIPVPYCDPPPLVKR